MAKARTADPRTETTTRRITQAAYTLLAEQGVMKLSLDAVARAAGVGKGTLLYHFSTKSDLLQHVLKESLAGFDQLVQELRGEDCSPGSWARAYLKATLDERHIGNGAASALYLAPLDRDPALLGILQEANLLWTARLESDGLNPLVARVVRVAADGCWWSEIAGTPPFDARVSRVAFVRYMLDQIEASVSMSEC